MRKLKVIQLLPELNSGGVERGTIEVGKYLFDQGHESIVVSNGGRMVEQLIREGSKHVKIPVHRKNPISLLLLPKLRKLFISEKPDIIHARSRIPAWLCFLTLKLIKKEIRPKFVTTVHGFYSVNYFSSIMTKGDAVICVSNSIREYVLENYPKTSLHNTYVIHRGIRSNDYNFSHKPNQEWLNNWYKDFPNTKNAKLLVLPGRITRLKGHEEFLEIIKELGDEYFGLIIGYVNKNKKKYFDELKSSAELMGISERITFLGHRDDLKDIFSISFCVFSLSTKPESFGRIVLEALSVGIPVIGYDIGGVAEILDQLLPQGKIARQDIRSAVSLIRKWDRYPVFPKKNTSFVLEKMLAEIVNVYVQLISR